MALVPQTIPVIFDKGLDTKTASQLTIQGSFTTLQDVIRLKTGRYDKRLGFGQATNVVNVDELEASQLDEALTYYGVSTMTNLWGLDTVTGGLVARGNNRISSYSETANSWYSTLSTPEMAVSYEPVVTVSSPAFVSGSWAATLGFTTTLDVAYNNGLIAIIAGAEGSEFGSSALDRLLYVIDEKTKKPLHFPIPLVTTSTQQAYRVMPHGDSFVVFYTELTSSGNLWADKYDLGSFAFTTQYDITTANGGSHFDVVRYVNEDDEEYYFYTVQGAAGAGIEIGVINGTTFVVENSQTLGTRTSVGLWLSVDTTNLRAYATAVSTTGAARTHIAGVSFTSAFAFSKVGHAALYTDANATIGEIDVLTDSMCVTSAPLASGALAIFYSGLRVNTTDKYMSGTARSIHTVSVGGPSMTFSAAVAAEYIYPGCDSISKPFVVDGIPYVNLAYGANYDVLYTNVGFIGGHDGAVASRYAVDLGPHVSTDNNQRCNVVAGANGNYYTVAPVLKTFSDDTPEYSIALLTIKTDDVQKKGVSIGQGHYFPGGTIQYYSGTTCTEQGFHINPTQVEEGTPDTGTVPVGDYLFAISYEWTDPNGVRYESQPSATTSINFDGSEKKLVTLYNYPFARARGTVVVNLYMSEADGDILYLKEQTEITWTTLSDAIEITTGPDTSKRILYTTGGVLGHTPMPPCSSMTEFKNRLVFVGLDVPSKLGFTKKLVNLEQLAFNTEFTIDIPAKYGHPKVVANLDDNLIVFTDGGALYQISGDGPNELGQLSTFTDPSLIQTDVGSTNPNSLAVIDKGLLFQSDKGIFILTRSLQTQYIGAAVEDYNDLVITSATVIETRQEVRFTTRTGETLVYNYFYDQWMTHTNYVAEASTFWDGRFVHGKTDGSVHIETPDAYLDTGTTAITPTLVTSWLSFAGVLGFKRIYWINFLSQFFANYTQRIEIAYDFENTYSETVNVDSADSLSTSTVMDFRHKPARQKCSSIRLRLKAIDATGETEDNGSETAAPIGLTFVVGTKSGSRRNNSRKTV